MRGKRGSWAIVVVCLLVGVFVGNKVGEALRATLPVMARYGALDLPAREVSVLDFAFTLGLRLKVNLGGALGGLLGIFLARRI